MRLRHVLVMLVGLPGIAQADALLPVSADVATIKGDLLLWGGALMAIALAMWAYRAVTGMIDRELDALRQSYEDFYEEFGYYPHSHGEDD